MAVAKFIIKGAVISDRRDGMKLKDIAEKYGIPLNTVKSYLHEAKVTSKAETMETKEKRKAAVLELKGSGMSRKEIAEEVGVDYSTVSSYIEEERRNELPEGMTYKESRMVAVRKKDMMEWARRQIAATLNTPDGPMTVAAVYPHNIDCISSAGSGDRLTVIHNGYPLGVLYYMNQREETYAY